MMMVIARTSGKAFGGLGGLGYGLGYGGLGYGGYGLGKLFLRLSTYKLNIKCVRFIHSVTGYGGYGYPLYARSLYGGYGPYGGLYGGLYPGYGFYG